MKQSFQVLFLATLLLGASCGILNGAPVVAYVDRLTSWWGCNVAEALGLPNGPTNGPNVIALSFWTTGSVADAVSVWSSLNMYIPENCGYGSSSSEIQRNLIQKFHANGVKVIVAAFGATNNPTSEDPTQVCTNIAQFVLANNLDGVDLDYEDSNAFERGVGAQWLITCTKVIRQYLPQGQYILTHAPQGPYFTTGPNYPDGAYLTVDREVGQLIDWYNLQYYNQGTGVYESYDDCFVKCSAWPGTAVLELKGLKSKVAVGKPVTQSDANNGWVAASTFAEWLQRANQAGWCGGAMYWQKPSDSDGSFGVTMKSTIDKFTGCNNVWNNFLEYI